MQRIIAAMFPRAQARDYLSAVIQQAQEELKNEENEVRPEMVQPVFPIGETAKVNGRLWLVKSILAVWRESTTLHGLIDKESDLTGLQTAYYDTAITPLKKHLSRNGKTGGRGSRFTQGIRELVLGALKHCEGNVVADKSGFDGKSGLGAVGAVLLTSIRL